jgi:histidinol-phosphate aminotransferase
MDTVLLDRNENQYGPAPACYKVLREANLEQLSLYSRAYAAGKKSELSDRLSRDLGIPERNVLLSYGSEDMLKQVVHCYLHSGQTILLPRQSWWYYQAIAKEVFGKEAHYPMHERNGRFEYDLDEILKLYDQHKPQVILIASPNNPTGNTIPPETLSAIVGHCKESVVVLDEAYAGFNGTGNELMASLLAKQTRVVVLRTFSKYFALAGLRIGYACVGEGLEQLISFSARYLGYNQLSEKIALAALDDLDYYVDVTRKMKADKQMYMTEFGAIEGFTAFPSDANFILIRYPRQHKQPLKAGLVERGVVVKFLDDPGLEDCIRITIGTQEQNARVMAAFKEVAGTVLHLPMHSHAGPSGR